MIFINNVSKISTIIHRLPVLDAHSCFQKIYSLVISCHNTCEYDNKTYTIEKVIEYNKLRNTKNILSGRVNKTLMAKHVVKNEKVQQLIKIYSKKIVRIFDTIEIK